MRVCVIAGMIDAKLHSKLAPIQALDFVERIDLLRRRPYAGDKLTCRSTPRFLPGWMPLAETWRLAALVRTLLLDRPDVIVAFGVVPHGVYAWLCGKALGIPVIQHVMGKNDLRLTFPGQRGKRLTLAAVKAAERVAVRGAGMRRWLEDQGVPAERIFVPQNLHDFELFAPDSTGSPDHDFVYVGLLSAYKRIDLLLDALALLRRDQPGARLLLVGDGPERGALEAQSARLGLSEQVTFAGLIPFVDLPGQYRRARAFVMTSQGEGLPMAMIEALSCGLPVVVPADADFEDVARDGENALIVRRPSPEAFGQAMGRLLSDTELHRRLAKGALRLRESKQAEYSLERQAEAWRTALQGLGGIGS